MSHKQHNALTKIRNSKDIIIKEADKGSGIVIMNTRYYKEKNEEMLDDETNYSRMPSNKDKSILTKINKLCQKFDYLLTKKEKEYLTKFDSKTSNFYGLPKIHKSTIIKKAIKTQNAEYIEIIDPRDLTFRPI